MFCHNYLCTKSFILVIDVKKIKYFLLFPIVELAVNYAKIGWVGNFETGFQQVPFV